MADIPATLPAPIPPEEARYAEAIRKEVQLILTNASQPALRAVSRIEMVESLKRELTYLNAMQTVANATGILNSVLQQNIDYWVRLYLNRPPYISVAVPSAIPPGPFPTLVPYSASLDAEPPVETPA